MQPHFKYRPKNAKKQPPLRIPSPLSLEKQTALINKLLAGLSPRGDPAAWDRVYLSKPSVMPDTFVVARFCLLLFHIKASRLEIVCPGAHWDKLQEAIEAGGPAKIHAVYHSVNSVLNELDDALRHYHDAPGRDAPGLSCLHQALGELDIIKVGLVLNASIEGGAAEE